MSQVYAQNLGSAVADLPRDPEHFWTLSVNGGLAPLVRHYSLEAARKEAGRLAAKTGLKVFILETVLIAEAEPNINWTRVP